VPRRNAAAHGRRLKAHPAAFAGEANAIGPEGMARSLVERGLASEVILESPIRHDQSKENRPHDGR
jgi:hypothetical protein